MAAAAAVLTYVCCCREVRCTKCCCSDTIDAAPAKLSLRTSLCTVIIFVLQYKKKEIKL